jgi:hypothetical protein
VTILRLGFRLVLFQLVTIKEQDSLAVFRGEFRTGGEGEQNRIYMSSSRPSGATAQRPPDARKVEMNKIDLTEQHTQHASTVYTARINRKILKKNF